MKRIILLMLTLLLFTGCSHNDKENEIDQKQTNAINKVRTDEITIAPNVTTITTPIITPEVIRNVNVEDNELLKNLKELCKSPRRFNTDGENRALDFLIDKMTEYGYDTTTQEFSVYKKTLTDIYSATVWQYFDKYKGDKDSAGKGTNLIATTTNPDKKNTLYITAHYDTTRDTKGIRDNGSGVVVAMEIARQLQTISLPINIEFIFFSAEETGMQGSAYFVSQLTQEEKDNALGCINIDVVGEKGANEVVLKTYLSQINVLSLLMDEYHEFHHSRSEASDHTSFYMGEIPAIYFADEKVKTKDNTVNPLEELDIEKLKELTRIICDYIINFDIDDYNNLLKNSYTKEYTDLPNNGNIEDYTLIQVNKILREDGAGSNKQYIWKNSEGNQVVITEMDSRFFSEDLTEELQSFNSYNDYTKYKIFKENNITIVKYVDLVAFRLYELKGNIIKDEALELLNNQSVFNSNVTLINALN